MCATFSKEFFCDIVCGEPVRAVGLGGELLRKHCGEGGGVTRTCGPQRREISRRLFVRACLLCV